MTCSRCCGFMVEDHFLDLEGAYGEMWTTSGALYELRAGPRLRDRAESTGPTEEGLGLPKWRAGLPG